MKVLKHIQYTGRKSSSGKLCFDENGRAVVFVDYCSDCRGKVVMSREEAKQFAALYSDDTRRLGTRLVDWIMSRNRVPQTPFQQAVDRDELKREILKDMAAAIR